MTYYLQPYWEYNEQTRESTLLHIEVWDEGRLINPLIFQSLDDVKEKLSHATLINWDGSIIHKPDGNYTWNQLKEAVEKALNEKGLNDIKIGYIDIGRMFYGEPDVSIDGGELEIS